jgi:hypothetical protein
MNKSPTPYDQAREWQNHIGSSWHLAHVIAAHGDCGGQVHITPELFVLARPVRREWPDERICDPQEVATEPDCWHVWLLAGDIAAALRLLPYPLPFMSWHRGDRFRVYRIEDVLRRFAR